MTTLSFRNNRLIPNAIEPRAPTPATTVDDDDYTLYVANQNPHVERLLMAPSCSAFPSTRCAWWRPTWAAASARRSTCTARRRRCVWASKQISRPIKWTAERCGSVPVRRARPRPRHDGRAGLDNGRQVPRAARRHTTANLGAYLSTFASCDPDHPVRDAAGRPVHDAEDLLRGDGGVHQHRAGRRLPRRGPPGGDLRRRAHSSRRRRTELKIDPAEIRRRNFITELPVRRRRSA